MRICKRGLSIRPANAPCAVLPRFRDFPKLSTVHLIFIHGAPATGKYTVARDLATLTGYELYHNHLVVDEVLKAHAFGSPGFISERDRHWRAHFTQAVCESGRKLIFTFNPENTVPQAFIDWMFTDLPHRGARLFSVQLTASEAEIEARLNSTQRQGFKKLTDLEFYRQLRDSGSFALPVLPPADLVLDTGRLAPAEAARTIAARIAER